MKMTAETRRRVNNVQLDKYAELWLAKEMVERLSNDNVPKTLNQIFKQEVVERTITKMVAQRHPGTFRLFEHRGKTYIDLV